MLLKHSSVCSLKCIKIFLLISLSAVSSTPCNENYVVKWNVGELDEDKLREGE